jgi:hypothetical protein
MVFENILLPKKKSDYKRSLNQGLNLMQNRNFQKNNVIKNSNVFQNAGSPVEAFTIREGLNGSDSVKILAGQRKPDKLNADIVDRTYNIVNDPKDNTKSTDMFWNQRQKMKKESQDFEQEYTKLIGEYKESSGIAMQKWNEYKQQVGNCKNKLCEKDQYKTEGEKTACRVGCELYGPYVSSCETTLKDESIWKAASKPNAAVYCSSLANEANKCSGLTTQGGKGKVNLNSSVPSAAESGCCECGGGRGGRPQIKMDGNFYQSCNDFLTSDTKKACNAVKSQRGCDDNLCPKGPGGTRTGAYIDSAAHKFNSKHYQKQVEINEKLRNKVGDLSNKVGSLDLKNQRLRQVWDDEVRMYRGTGTGGEQDANSLLKQFSNKQVELADIIGKARILRKGEPADTRNHTLLAMHQDIGLKLNSEKLKFGMWGVLAVILGIATITNFNKKLD